MTAVDGAPEPLSRAARDALMPLHLEVGADGRICHVGPTLQKLRPGADLCQMSIDQLFELRCRETKADLHAMRARPGPALRLRFREPPHITLRGQIVDFPIGGGSLLNLALGTATLEAISTYGLSATDFAPTDPTVEMLFLIEANAAVAREWRGIVTRLDEARSAAEKEALTDPLTGLLNRRGFDLAMGQVAAERHPFSVMVVDMDHFKAVNDTHGHLAGDAALKALAEILAEEVRNTDVISRIGGDEFAVLLPRLADRDSLDSAAGRILERLLRPLPVGNDVKIPISVSIGTASHCSLKPEEVADALSAADRALYAAKAAGRGRTIHASREVPSGTCPSPHNPSAVSSA